MNAPFELDSRLAADTFPVGDLPACRVLLMNDARFPWLILVPRFAGLVELDDLDRDNRIAVMDEVHRCTAALRATCRVDKINLGALGNVVRQLHLHVVGRTAEDAAWPGPVWGSGPPRPYEKETAGSRILALTTHLDEQPVERSHPVMR